MKFERTIAFAASPAEVWCALAYRAHSGAEWARELKARRVLEKFGADEVELRQGPASAERVETLDESSRTLSYELVDGVPSLVRYFGVTWSVVETEEGARATLSVNADLQRWSRWFVEGRVHALCDDIFRSALEQLEDAAPISGVVTRSLAAA